MRILFYFKENRIRFLTLCFTVLFVLSSLLSAEAQVDLNDLFLQLNLESRFIEVSIVEDQKITTLYGKNAESTLYPASITKVLSTIVALDHLNDRLDELVTVQPEDLAGLTAARASVAGFVVGETLSIRELLYGALLPSGADATNVLARLIAGSTEDYIKLLNQKAHQIGMKNSQFVNVTGLYHEQHYSTAHDLNLLLAHALENDTFVEMSSTMRYTTQPNNRRRQGITLNHTIYTTARNQQIELKYITGGKTGWIPQSGYNLSSYHQYYDKTILITTGDAYTPGSNFKDHEKIYQALLETSHEVVMIEPGQSLGYVPMDYVWGIDNVKLSLTQPLSVEVSVIVDKDNLNMNISHPDRLEAPLETNSEIGTVAIYHQDELLAERTILTSSAYQRSNLLYFLAIFVQFVLNHRLLITIIGGILVLIILVGVLYSYMKRRQRRKGKRKWKL